MYIYDHRSLGAQSPSYIWTHEGLAGPSSEKQVAELMKQLRPLFQKNFSKNKITYGPMVGKAVKFHVATDKDFKAEVENEAKRLANSMMPMVLKFAPEIAQKKLLDYYKSIQVKFPARLNTINEKTKLSAEEEAIIFTLSRVLIIEKVKADADNVGGFYSPSTKEIVFRDFQLDAGTVAHEMAHAYANQGWYDFIDMMRLRGMKDTDKLDEGMTTYIERIVVMQWFAKQPNNTLIPRAGYGSSYTDRADEFVKALGKDWAYEAYFGGWINYSSNDKPEDSLVIGNKKKKKWKWPWR